MEPGAFLRKLLLTYRRARLEAAANVAVVVDDLDTTDEAMNLLARHNIPFKVLRPADLKSGDLRGLRRCRGVRKA